MTPAELEAVTHWQVVAAVGAAGTLCFGVTATGPDKARAKAEAVLGDLPGERALVYPVVPSRRRAG